MDGIDDQWDIDMMAMSHLAKDNDGVTLILLAIDTCIFSRHVSVQLLKSKHGIDVVNALKAIFD